MLTIKVNNTFLRFFSVVSVCYFFDLGLFTLLLNYFDQFGVLLHGIALSPKVDYAHFIARLLSFFLVIAVAYYLQSNFTFQRQDKSGVPTEGSRMHRFFIVALFSFIIQVLFFPLLLQWLKQHIPGADSIFIDYAAITLLGLLALICNYYLHKNWTFD